MSFTKINKWTMRSTVVAATAAIVLAYFAFATGSQKKPGALFFPDNAEIVAKGKVVYDENCASCHGENLEGQPNWRRRDEEGFLPAPPHDQTGHTWHHTDDVLFNITKLGTAKFINDSSYKTTMQSYDGILTDDEIVAALSYIKSTWPENIRRRHDEMNAMNAKDRSK